MNQNHPLFQAGAQAGFAAAMQQLAANGPNPRPPGAPVPGIPGQVPQSGMPVQQGQPVPPGAVVQYFSDLASGVIVPEDMRIECLEYRVQIDPLGNVVFQTPSRQLVSRFQFAIRRVQAFIQNPGVAGDAPSLVRFNLQEQGRNFTVFKDSVSPAPLLQEGSSGLSQWDGVYICIPGTQLEALWTIDRARWGALVGATKEIGIQVIGDYVACTPNDE
jgi:hypothetical protein